MNKAFIIDDDYGAILSIYNSLDWERLKISTIVKISDPCGAAEKILLQKPDVVFIDIEMGEVSGLDIIAEVRAKGLDTIFVIISGHNDFAYAQTAIKYGVKYYLLKPIMPSVVDEVTELLCDTLRKMSKLDGDALDISSILSNKERFNMYLAKKNVTFPGEYMFLVVQLSRSNADDIILCLNDSLCAHYKIGQKKHLFILNAKSYTVATETRLRNIAAAKSCLMGISDVFSCEEDIYISFKQANTLSYGYFISEVYDVYHNYAVGGALVRNFLDVLLGYLDKKKYALFFEKLSTAPDYFKENHFNIKQALLMHNTIAFKINSDYNKCSVGDPMPILNSEDLIEEYITTRGMCAELEEMLKGLLEYPDEEVVSQTDTVIQGILEYIDANYAQKLTLSVVSKHFYISISHLCELFRKNLNQTFIEYLTNFRMQKAKDLMADNSISITKIAENVGCPDYFYFNKLFRKYIGCSPSEYRKKLGNDGMD